MYNIIFYSTADGTSELRDFLINLRKKSLTNKDARIQHKQIAQYIQLLEDHGTYLGENIYGNYDRGTTAFCSSITRMTLTFSCTCFVSAPKRRLEAKSRKPNANVMTG